MDVLELIKLAQEITEEEIEREKRELSSLPDPGIAERILLRRKPKDKGIRYDLHGHQWSVPLTVMRTLPTNIPGFLSSLLFAIAHEDPRAFIADVKSFEPEHKAVAELARLGDPEVTRDLIITDKAIKSFFVGLDPRRGIHPHLFYVMKFLSAPGHLELALAKNMAYFPEKHTIVMSAASPAALAHELGHAADFARSRAPGVYDLVARLPLATLYREVRAWKRGSHIVVNGAVKAFPRLNSENRTKLVNFLIRTHKMMDKIRPAMLTTYGVHSAIAFMPSPLREILFILLAPIAVGATIPAKIINKIYRIIIGYSGKEDLKRKIKVHAKINGLDKATTRQMLDMVEKNYDKVPTTFKPTPGAANLALQLSRLSTKIPARARMAA